eukprot:g3867.t1
MRRGHRVRNERHRRYVAAGIAVFVATIMCYVYYLRTSDLTSLSSDQTLRTIHKEDSVYAVTWNVAAINNNPFEYWIRYDKDPRYNKMMIEIQDMIDRPSLSADLPLSKILTPSMIQELTALMRQRTSWNADTIDSALAEFEEKYKERHAISQFLKDPTIGVKRLVSMPDRSTNTIQSNNAATVYRPAVLNCYDSHSAKMGVSDWWSRWTSFMFKSNVPGSSMKPFERLVKIKRSKYPAVTESEEAMSLPLQTYMIAAFDAILIHIMNQVAPHTWQDIRRQLCLNLNAKKNDRIVEILRKTYGDADVIFLQEVASSFLKKIRSSVSEFAVLSSKNINLKRDQNSVILIRRSRFDPHSMNEVSRRVEDTMKRLETRPVPVAQGDIFAITIRGRVDKRHYLLASFHGDTNGLATIPV